MPVNVLNRIDACDSSLKDSEVADAIQNLCEHWFTTAKHVEMKGVDGAPDWLGYEGRIWELGESVRQCMLKRKDWRRWHQLFGTIAAIAANPKYGKGRESLVLLLGEFAADQHRDVLIMLLDDPEVVSHAIMALRRGKIADAVEKVRTIIARERSGRTRAEAKKYLKAFGAA